MQLLTFLRQRRDLVVPEAQRVQFGDLELQQFESRCAIGIRGFELGDLLRHRLPLLERSLGHGAYIVQAAEIIEQVPLHIATPERLVKVLAVDVQQHFAKSFQALQRHGIAVDECAGSPVGIDDPPQDAFVVEVQHLFVEPLPGFRQVFQVEFCRELRPVRAAARETGSTALA